MRFLTAGFSHGKGLMLIIDGFPANVPVDEDLINIDLARRQSGYGRGGRQKIERDRVEILSGVLNGRTTGSPIGAIVWNKDYSIDKMPDVFCPRPGHADLAGAIKYNQGNIRHILERASARETAMRVVAGGFARLFLRELGIKSIAFVRAIGGVYLEEEDLDDWSMEMLERTISLSDVFCPSPEKSELMKKRIDEAKEENDTLGGVVEVWIRGVPVGVGDFTQWDRRLDGRLAQAVMSVPAIKGVEIGAGFRLGDLTGKTAHDAIYYSKEKGIYRHTNNAGGLEGGMSNGEDIVVRAVMKPIATVGQPLDSIDIRSGEPAEALVERFDTCAVPAASVVVEAMCLWAVAEAVCDKFGRDELGDIKRAVEDYKKNRRML